MRIPRVAIYTVSAIALCALLAAPTARAASRQPEVPGPVFAIGHIAYLTKSQKIELATVAANGSTSAVTKIGPTLAPKPKQHIQIFALMGSGDGKWLAWSEVATINKPFTQKDRLVLRRQSTGTVYHVATAQFPVGFAGDRLITSSGDTTKQLVLTPTPHLVRLHHESQAVFALAAYRHGLVDTVSNEAPPGPSHTDKVRLSSLGGKRVILHRYVLGASDFRDPDGAWVSNDGKHVVIERGNHQDFGGLGPSSLADEFALTGGHSRSQLGHYGTAKAEWRIASVSYSGKSDAVWAVWERGTKSGGTSLLARHEHGTWAPITKRGIAVAGNRAGYVVSQPGKYVLVGQDGVPTAVPTGHALLIHGATTTPMIIKGSVFVWVKG